MKYNWVEVFTGAAVLIMAIVFASYTFRIAGGGGHGDQYPVVAEFISAEGINSGVEVRMSGVNVGRVGNMQLNPETYGANVELLIDEAVEIPADSEVKIAMDGLLGGAFVEIVPGADIVTLQEGDSFLHTTGSVSLLSLFASFVTGSGTKSENAQ